eukprot:TRINITY_DN2599_c0_g1_i1.p1 TRINITY_DN2599_c0_g1~~TRINITY_DN2599_c0_g1_i1.p1  ORF type:complete len:247 (-),score=22.87 TRINITY_DN2599_c0_g1_i1:130-837(-)
MENPSLLGLGMLPMDTSGIDQNTSQSIWAPIAEEVRALLLGTESDQESGESLSAQHEALLSLANPLPLKLFCLVEFKRGRRLQYESPMVVSPGEYVIVGGDRGEDLGIVVHTWAGPPSNRNEIEFEGSPVHMGAQPEIGKVIRKATTKEIQYLHTVQAELEKRCAEVCQQKVLEHGLIMVIVDAEYQFDRKKLTFYYDAAERQDFRDLVRDLYKLYRARIWMSKISPSTHFMNAQ